MTQRIPWPRVLAEGVVIVLSILLALAGDAWWDEVQDRRAEQRLLVSLAEDFREARDTLVAGIAAHRGTLEAADRLIDFAASGGSTPVPDFFSGVHRVLSAYATTHLRTGALDGAPGSGGLALVSDGELRALLAEWPRTLVEFTEQELYIADLVRESTPVLASAAPIANQLRSGRLGGSDEPTAPVELVEFLASPMAANLAALRLDREFLAVRDGEILLSAIDNLIGALEHSIR